MSGVLAGGNGDRVGHAEVMVGEGSGHHNGFVNLNRCYCFCFQVGKQVQKGGVNFPKPHSKSRARIREPLPVSFGP